ncbi:MAG: hypothetical protein ABSE05_06480 [Syntrophales bacterium]
MAVSDEVSYITGKTIAVAAVSPLSVIRPLGKQDECGKYQQA